jgi:hypothetical protein
MILVVKKSLFFLLMNINNLLNTTMGIVHVVGERCKNF